MLMLNSMPIDIVEIIIVKSFDYNTFQKLQKCLTKLQEPSRITRINDKLTIFKRIFFGSFSYDLNGNNHREYDKPDFIGHVSFVSWYINNKRNRINNPSICWIDGNREWYLNDEYYRTDDYPSIINETGEQVWCDKNRKPKYVNVFGTRENTYYAFYYL